VVEQMRKLGRTPPPVDGDAAVAVLPRHGVGPPISMGEAAALSCNLPPRRWGSPRLYTAAERAQREIMLTSERKTTMMA
jgi:hypothetical protein